MSVLLLAAAGLLTLIPRAAWAVPLAPASPEARKEMIAASILGDIGHATWIAEGQNRHVIYIFFDPNCPYCRKLYEDFRPWVNKNEVQLRWMPVGVLTKTSPGKAAAILGARNPLAAFRRNEEGSSRASGFGKISGEPFPKLSINQELRVNEELLDRTGENAVPTLVFRVKDGTPILIEGSPPRRFLGEIVDQLK
ncbi:MAG: thiol:disulfide interchange protein DsbG [Acidiferrobacterales bacterium]